jgi:hypothetical protein
LIERERERRGRERERERRMWGKLKKIPLKRKKAHVK